MPEKRTIFILPVLVHFYAVADIWAVNVQKYTILPGTLGAVCPGLSGVVVRPSPQLCVAPLALHGGIAGGGVDLRGPQAAPQCRDGARRGALDATSHGGRESADLGLGGTKHLLQWRVGHTWPRHPLGILSNDRWCRPHGGINHTREAPGVLWAVLQPKRPRRPPFLHGRMPTPPAPVVVLRPSGGARRRAAPDRSPSSR
jgi:hypothetical protein